MEASCIAEPSLESVTLPVTTLSCANTDIEYNIIGSIMNASSSRLIFILEILLKLLVNDISNKLITFADYWKKNFKKLSIYCSSISYCVGIHFIGHSSVWRIFSVFYGKLLFVVIFSIIVSVTMCRFYTFVAQRCMFYTS